MEDIRKKLTGTVGGKYKVTENGVKTRGYSMWYNMITRLTNKKELEKFPRYKECSICEEWLDFQNFAKWFEDNWYECDGEKMCLDKDILDKGNQVYGPDKCIIVPETINILFTKSDKIRGKYPIGVYLDGDKYKAQLSYQEEKRGKKKRKNLGRFLSVEDAFSRYKKAKEEYIKIVADRYKDEIPEKLYKALYDYKVEVED